MYKKQFCTVLWFEYIHIHVFMLMYIHVFCQNLWTESVKIQKAYYRALLKKKSRAQIQQLRCICQFSSRNRFFFPKNHIFKYLPNIENCWSDDRVTPCVYKYNIYKIVIVLSDWETAHRPTYWTLEMKFDM